MEEQDSPQILRSVAATRVRLSSHSTPQCPSSSPSVDPRTAFDGMTVYPSANPQNANKIPMAATANGDVVGDSQSVQLEIEQNSDSAIVQISGLLSGLIDDQHLPADSKTGVKPAIGPKHTHQSDRFENDLAMVRLGVATSLFIALRAKHPPTASHCLRAAIACSAWCERLKLADDVRDRIEVAALLHDIGKIGIPDSILKKPGKLTLEEQNTVELCPLLGVEILKGCTTDKELLDIVRLGQAWYDGRREEDSPRCDELPFGARMLSIVEAFDSMTTDHVYRPAMVTV